jgi:2-polyprenyl-3-methyl-5-hydroxy-6-metoxy-1,4-benzoquinol methylase
MTDLSAYDRYEELKGWDKAPFMNPSPGEIMFYEHYLGRLNMNGAKVLEIGFGNGNFIGWAKQRGAIVYGTELQQSAVEKATQFGVNVLPTEIRKSVDLLRGQLTAMAALDVMEHLSIEQNISFLTSAAMMLKRDGLLLIRFPNGQSPMGLAVQYGDRSHVSVLSIPIINQLIIDLPFVVAYAGEPLRTLTGGITSKLVRHIQTWMRHHTTRLIRSLYGDIPMYMNAVMVLRNI